MSRRAAGTRQPMEAAARAAPGPASRSRQPSRGGEVYGCGRGGGRGAVFSTSPSRGGVLTSGRRWPYRPMGRADAADQ